MLVHPENGSHITGPALDYQALLARNESSPSPCRAHSTWIPTAYGKEGILELGKSLGRAPMVVPLAWDPTRSSLVVSSLGCAGPTRGRTGSRDGASAHCSLWQAPGKE